MSRQRDLKIEINVIITSAEGMLAELQAVVAELATLLVADTKETK